jgi:hypothetical protein
MKKEDYEKLDWTVEVSPELYSRDINPSGREGKKWFMIRNKVYGLYEKKDAEIICEFLRKNFISMVYFSLNRERYPD